MLKLFKFIIPILFLSSCVINQDYHFEENGEVQMNILVDMSALFKSMPAGEGGNKFGNIQDSIKAAGIEDSLEQYGLTKFEMDFDTVKHTLTSNMMFKNLEYFEKFINKDNKNTEKPIEVIFSKSKFIVKNCTALISTEMLNSLGGGEKKDSKATEEMDMSNFFKFKTTYHFPYEVDSFKSKSGNGMLSEDKKSISFDNKLDDFSVGNHSDFKVEFK